MFFNCCYRKTIHMPQLTPPEKTVLSRKTEELSKTIRRANSKLEEFVGIEKELHSITQTLQLFSDNAEREKPMKGKVLATGPGKIDEKGNRVAMSVKVGDVVLFKKYGPDEIEMDGKKYLVGEESDVLAIIE